MDMESLQYNFFTEKGFVECLLFLVYPSTAELSVLYIVKKGGLAIPGEKAQPVLGSTVCPFQHDLVAVDTAFGSVPSFLYIRERTP
jgi:hypothetical protein